MANLPPFSSLDLVDQLFIKNNPSGYLEELQKKGFTITANDLLANYRDNLPSAYIKKIEKDTKTKPIKPKEEKSEGKKEIIVGEQLAKVIKENVKEQILEEIDEILSSEDDIRKELKTAKGIALDFYEQELNKIQRLKRFENQDKYIKDRLDTRANILIQEFNEKGITDKLNDLYIAILKEKSKELPTNETVAKNKTNNEFRVIALDIVKEQVIIKDIAKTKEDIKNNEKAIQDSEKLINKINEDILKLNKGQLAIPRVYDVSTYRSFLLSKIGIENDTIASINDKLIKNKESLDFYNNAKNNLTHTIVGIDTLVKNYNKENVKQTTSSEKEEKARIKREKEEQAKLKKENEEKAKQEKEKQELIKKQKQEQIALQKQKLKEERELKLFGKLTPKQKLDYNGIARAYAGAISQTPNYEQTKDFKLVEVFSTSDFSPEDIKKFPRQSSWVQTDQGYARVYNGKIITIYAPNINNKEQALALKNDPMFLANVDAQLKINKQQYEIKDAEGRKESKDKWLLEQKKAKLIEKGIQEFNGKPIEELTKEDLKTPTPFDRQNELDTESNARRGAKEYLIGDTKVKLYKTKDSQYKLFDENIDDIKAKKRKAQNDKKKLFALDLLQNKTIAYRGNKDSDGNAISKGRFYKIKYNIQDSKNQSKELTLNVKLENYQPNENTFQRLEEYHRPIDLDQTSLVKLVRETGVSDEKSLNLSIDNLYQDTGDNELLKKAKITQRLNDQIVQNETILKKVVGNAFEKSFRASNPDLNDEQIRSMAEQEFAKFMRSSITNGKFVYSENKGEQFHLPVINDINIEYKDKLQETLKQLPYDIKMYKGIVIALDIKQKLGSTDQEHQELYQKELQKVQTIVNKAYLSLSEQDPNKKTEIQKNPLPANNPSYVNAIQNSIDEYYFKKPKITEQKNQLTFNERKEKRKQEQKDAIEKNLKDIDNKDSAKEIKKSTYAKPKFDTSFESYADYLAYERQQRDENFSTYMQYRDALDNDNRAELFDIEGKIKLKQSQEDAIKNVANKMVDKLGTNADAIKENLKNSTDILAELSKLQPSDPKVPKLKQQLIKYKVNTSNMDAQNLILGMNIEKYVDTIDRKGISNERMQNYYKYDRARRILQKNGETIDNPNLEYQKKLNKIDELDRRLNGENIVKDNKTGETYRFRLNETIDPEFLKGKTLEKKTGLIQNVKQMSELHNLDIDTITIPTYTPTELVVRYEKDDNGKIILDSKGNPTIKAQIQYYEEDPQTLKQMNIKYGSKEYYDRKQLLIRDLVYVDAEIKQFKDQGLVPPIKLTDMRIDIQSKVNQMQPEVSPFEIKKLRDEQDKLTQTLRSLENEINKNDNSMSVDQAREIFNELNDKGYTDNTGKIVYFRDISNNDQARATYSSKQSTFDNIIQLMRNTQTKSYKSQTVDDLLVKQAMIENKTLIDDYNIKLTHAKKLLNEYETNREIGVKAKELSSKLDTLQNIVENAIANGDYDADENMILDTKQRLAYYDTIKSILTDKHREMLDKNPNRLYDSQFQNMVIRQAHELQNDLIQQASPSVHVNDTEYHKQIEQAKQIIKQYGRYLSVEHMLINEDINLREQLNDRINTEERFVKQIKQDYQQYLFVEEKINAQKDKNQKVEDRVNQKLLDDLSKKLNETFEKSETIREIKELENKIKDITTQQQAITNQEQTILEEQRSIRKKLIQDARSKNINVNTSLSKVFTNQITPDIIQNAMQKLATGTASGGGFYTDKQGNISFRASGTNGADFIANQQELLIREILKQIFDKNRPSRNEIEVSKQLHNLQTDTDTLSKNLDLIRDKIIDQIIQEERKLISVKNATDQKLRGIKDPNILYDASATAMISNAFYNDIFKNLDTNLSPEDRNKAIADQLNAKFKVHTEKHLRPIIDKQTFQPFMERAEDNFLTKLAIPGLPTDQLLDTIILSGVNKNETFSKFVDVVVGSDKFKAQNLDKMFEEEIKTIPTEEKEKLLKQQQELNRQHKELMAKLEEKRSFKSPADHARDRATKEFAEFVKTQQKGGVKVFTSFSEAIYESGVQNLRSYDANNKDLINRALEKGQHIAVLQEAVKLYSDQQEKLRSDEFDKVERIILGAGASANELLLYDYKNIEQALIGGYYDKFREKYLDQAISNPMLADLIREFDKYIASKTKITIDPKTGVGTFTFSNRLNLFLDFFEQKTEKDKSILGELDYKGDIISTAETEIQDLDQFRKLKGRWGINNTLEKYKNALQDATRAVVITIPGKAGRPKTGEKKQSKQEIILPTILEEMQLSISEMANEIRENISTGIIASYDQQLSLMKDNHAGIMGLLQLYGDGNGRLNFVDMQRLDDANTKLKLITNDVYDKVFPIVLASFSALPTLTEKEALRLAEISMQKLIGQIIDSDSSTIFNPSDTQIQDLTTSIFTSLETMANYDDEKLGKETKDLIKKIRESKTDIQILFNQNDQIANSITEILNDNWVDNIDSTYSEDPRVMDQNEFRRLLRAYHNINRSNDFKDKQTIQFFDKCREEFVKFMLSYVDETILKADTTKDRDRQNDSRVIKDIITKDGQITFDYNGEQISLGDTTNGDNSIDMRKFYEDTEFQKYLFDKQNYTTLSSIQMMNNLTNEIYGLFDNPDNFTNPFLDLNQMVKDRIFQFATDFMDNIIKNNTDMVRATVIHNLMNTREQFTQQDVDDMVNEQLVYITKKYQSEIVDLTETLVGGMLDYFESRIAIHDQLPLDYQQRQHILLQDKAQFIRGFLLGENKNITGLLDILTNNKFELQAKSGAVNNIQAKLIWETEMNMHRKNNARIVKWMLSANHKYQGGREICEMYASAYKLTPADQQYLLTNNLKFDGYYSIDLVPQPPHANCLCRTTDVSFFMNNKPKPIIDDIVHNTTTNDGWGITIIPDDDSDMPF